jgi:hypothetical protein
MRAGYSDAKYTQISMRERALAGACEHWEVEGESTVIAYRRHLDLWHSNMLALLAPSGNNEHSQN